MQGILFLPVLGSFIEKITHFLTLYTTPLPPHSIKQVEAIYITGQRGEKIKWHFHNGRISNVQGPKDIHDLTFLVFCTVSVINLKGIVKLRITLKGLSHSFESG
jgi:hypothetical protein